MSHYMPPPSHSGYNPPTPPPKKRSVGKIIGIVCASFVGLAMFGGCVSAISSDEGSDRTSSPTRSTVSTPTKDTGKSIEEEMAEIQEENRKNREKLAEESRKEAMKDGQYPDGDYEVGVDIEPGTYVSSGAKKGLFEFCSATTEPTDGSFGEMETANADERVILTVTATSGIVKISGCEPFERRT